MQDWPWIKPVCSPDRSGLQRTHILMRSAADEHSWGDNETRACSPNPTLSPNPSPSPRLGTPKSSQSLLSVKYLLSHFPPAHPFPASAPLCSLSSRLNVISLSLNNRPHLQTRPAAFAIPAVASWQLQVLPSEEEQHCSVYWCTISCAQGSSTARLNQDRGKGSFQREQDTLTFPSRLLPSY